MTEATDSLREGKRQETQGDWMEGITSYKPTSRYQSGQLPQARFWIVSELAIMRAEWSDPLRANQHAAACEG